MRISVRRSTNTYTKTGTGMNTGIRNNDSTSSNINANMMIRTRKNTSIIMCYSSDLLSFVVILVVA